MPRFAPYRPARRGVPDRTVAVRAAVLGDAPGLARVMATRGGTPASHLDRADALLDSADVLLVAVDGGGVLPVDVEDGPVPAVAMAGRGVVVGWCGVGRVRLDELAGGGADDRCWCVLGLTVDPVRQRRGIGARLLCGAVAGVRGLEPDAVVRSTVNAGNLASLSLHAQCGFREEARGPTFAGLTFDGGVGVLLCTS